MSALSNVMFEDIMTVYKPSRLRLMMRLRPRGGISSCLTIDSDWKIRGGNEEFGDYSNNTDQLVSSLTLRLAFNTLDPYFPEKYHAYIRLDISSICPTANRRI